MLKEHRLMGYTNIRGLGSTVEGEEVTTFPFTLTNSGTVNALTVDQNASPGTTSSVDGAIFIENTGNPGIGLGVYSNLGATADGALLNVHADNTAFDQRGINLTYDGTLYGQEIVPTGGGAGLRIAPSTSAPATNRPALDITSALSRTNAGTQLISVIDTSTGSNKSLVLIRPLNTPSVALEIDQDVTNTNRSTSSLDLTATSIVSDAATYTKSGSVVAITSNVTESSGTITDSAIVLDLNQAHADASGTVVDIDMDGTGKAIFVDHDDTGTNPSVDIDRDGNNAARIAGQKITVDNAGAGGVLGVDFSGMTTDEPLFSGTADAITAAGTVSHQIPILIGSTVFYLVAYTHGS